MDAKTFKLRLRFSIATMLVSCAVVAVLLALVVPPAVERHRKTVKLQQLGASVQYGNYVWPSFVGRLLPDSYCRPVTKVSFLATRSPDAMSGWQSEHGSFGSETAHAVTDLAAITEALQGIEGLQQILLFSRNHEHMASSLRRSLPAIQIVLVDGGLENG